MERWQGAQSFALYQDMKERVQVGDSFILMVALVGFLDESGLAPLFFLAAALHEMGHVLAVSLCGGTLLQLRLTAAGGVIRYRLPRISMLKDVCIAAAGPAFGLLAAWGAAALGYYRFAGANLLLSMLNLMPVRPLDGGQMITALLRGGTIQLVVEAGCCILLGLLSGMIFLRGGGCSLLIFTTILIGYLQKNLQNPCKRFKI